jgi:hypothetical protein
VSSSRKTVSGGAENAIGGERIKQAKRYFFMRASLFKERKERGR